MRLILFFLILSFPILSGCFFFIDYDKCLDPDCENATEYRFNLIDSVGNDVILSELYDYEWTDISVTDAQGIEASLSSYTVGEQNILAVTFDENVENYDLYLKDKKLMN